VICLVGGVNSNDYGTSRVLHHTIGLPDFGQELRCFQQVTCAQVVISDLDRAHEQIDHAISSALLNRKPVYISVCCNLAGVPHPSFAFDPVPYALQHKASNQRSLDAAIDAAAKFLNAAAKPVLIAGPKLRCYKAEQAFAELIDASDYPVAMMPDAKGRVSESHPHFIGTYWGNVSSPYCAEIVESADAYLFAGPIFNDYSSVGYSLLIKDAKSVRVEAERVTIGASQQFGCVLMADFLSGLGKKLKQNPTSFENYRRMYIPPGVPQPGEATEPLRTNVLFQHIQKLLTPDTAIVAETGDSWFNCQKLKLPDGCGYEFQMQYGSIGWSVGAVLGYAIGATDKRVIACIGDGSFQVTAQDVSTMIRYGTNPIIFLINNNGYTIEVEIHDGPYNNIKRWNYAALVNAFHNGEGKCWTTQVKTEEDLGRAIKVASEEEKDSLCFIEVFIHRDDCSKELLEWGSRVATANSRPPNPQ